MRFCYVLIATVLLASCVREASEELSYIVDNDGDIATKILFTSENAAKGRLLVRFEEESIAKVEAAVSRSGSVRSGIDDFDALSEALGIKSLRRLFPVDSRHEERQREAGLHRWYEVEFDESVNPDEAAAAMATVAQVERIEFDQMLKSVHDGGFTPLSPKMTVTATCAGTALFNDPQLNKQWHYINTGESSIYSGSRAGADVNCDEAWSVCAGSPDIIVAVIDNCIEWYHPDLAANMWTNSAENGGQEGVDDDGNGYADDIHGYNFYSDSTLAVSTSGSGPEHGTHVAGTIAAVNNNGVGVCGIAGGTGNGDGVKLMSCQIFHNSSSTNGSVTAKAIVYAANNGASILQCSYGYEAGTYTSDAAYAKAVSAEKEAIDYFIATSNCDALEGGLVIYAAGNDMRSMSGYPAAYRDYISVTATSCDFTPAYYTNYGAGCNIAAPGGDIYQNYMDARDLENSTSQVLSTVLDGGYAYGQGTSMACPHVSGVAALGLSYAHRLGKHFTLDEFKALLLTSVNDVDSYCTGSKYYVANSGVWTTLNLTPYVGKMGTGCIDAFQVLMNVEGTPCVPVRVGTKQAVDITNIVGGGAASIKFLGVDVSSADAVRLGIDGVPSVSNSGKLIIKCSRCGSGRLTVRFIAGGSNAGSDTTMGGMELSKEFVVVSRGMSRNEGWL